MYPLRLRQTVAPPPRPKFKFTSMPDVADNSPSSEFEDGVPVKGTYPGAVIDGDGPLNGKTWETVNYKSAVDLIYTFDSNLRNQLVGPNGKITELHPWQIEQLDELSAATPTQYQPYRLALCAANGSGKDKFVIAPFVVWFALTKVRSLSVITSSSGVQLTAQTENYIASLCHSINTQLGEKIFKVTRRFIKCLKSGSEIRLFATDEAGRAEGYHPLDTNSEMLIIVNEAKTVHPDIFGALSRCTGYNYWLNVSTPGEPYGDFYDSFTRWPSQYGPKASRRVTAYDCPHLGANHIEEVANKYGKNSAIFRSQILALFTQIGGLCVIGQDFLNTCIELSNKKITKPIVFGNKRIGLDLAAGRDECSFVCAHGNSVIDAEHFVERDTTETEIKAEKFLLRHGAQADPSGELKIKHTVEIYGDDGGLGHGILDRLVKKGYNIVRVLNQSRAFDHKQFGNRGAEMWFNVARLVEEKIIYLPLNQTGNPDDKKLYEQLTFRHYKKTEAQGRITLESKEEARANGHVSPDRADALVLAFSGTNLEELQAELKKTLPAKPAATLSIEQIFAMRMNRCREAVEQAYSEDKNKETICNNSVEALLRSRLNQN